jgi:hypothetical protein
MMPRDSMYLYCRMSRRCDLVLGLCAQGPDLLPGYNPIYLIGHLEWLAEFEIALGGSRPLLKVQVRTLGKEWAVWQV